MQELQKVEGLSVDELEAQTIELLPERVEMRFGWKPKKAATVEVDQDAVNFGDQENNLSAGLAVDNTLANVGAVNQASGDDSTFSIG